MGADGGLRASDKITVRGEGTGTGWKTACLKTMGFPPVDAAFWLAKNNELSSSRAKCERNAKMADLIDIVVEKALDKLNIQRGCERRIVLKEQFALSELRGELVSNRDVRCMLGLFWGTRDGGLGGENGRLQTFQADRRRYPWCSFAKSARGMFGSCS